MIENFDEIPRLAKKEALILGMLISRGERYGLQMVEDSEGRLKRGTVYVTLDRMESKGFIRSWQEEKHPKAIGPPRRLYKTTGFGMRVYQAFEALSREVAAGGQYA